MDARHRQVLRQRDGLHCRGNGHPPDSLYSTVSLLENFPITFWDLTTFTL
jgi:hypothetical protein